MPNAPSPSGDQSSQIGRCAFSCKQDTRTLYLKSALVAVGITFIAGLYVMMRLWPTGYVWTPPHPEYEQMMMGIYATLGVFLILAAKDPLARTSLHSGSGLAQSHQAL